MCINKARIIQLLEEFEKLDKKQILYFIISAVIKILTSMLEKYLK